MRMLLGRRVWRRHPCHLTNDSAHAAPSATPWHSKGGGCHGLSTTMVTRKKLCASGAHMHFIQ
ncbi:hypothetical protein HanIR_Chr12g0615081 [Helianthus annuus]|nr:hypothetical protein HanIR_Chr12g0615081 [Helianthus annuus]